jgi:hypothetical protein
MEQETRAMRLKRQKKMARQRNGKPMLSPQQKKKGEGFSPDSRKSAMQTRSAPAQGKRRRLATR